MRRLVAFCCAASLLLQARLAAEAADAPVRYTSNVHPAALHLLVGVGDAVTPIPNGVKSKECEAGGGVIAAIASDDNGHRFCVVASGGGLSVQFHASLPFVTTGTFLCANLGDGREDDVSASQIIAVTARVGRDAGGKVIYDEARAQCDVGTAFAYALGVETQSASNRVAADASGAEKPRSLTIPWKLLHLGLGASSIMLAINICAVQSSCSEHAIALEIPIAPTYTGISGSLQYGPYVRSAGSTTGSSATPARLHHIGLDGSYNWNARNLVLAAFAQDQSAVSAQRALSQALGLTPVSLPPIQPNMAISQTLQTRSQSLFAFQKPSESLGDQTLRPFFDTTPFSVGKLGSLASGYTYGYFSQDVNAAIVYGNQGPGVYAGGESLTFALSTPQPAAERTPVPKPTPPGGIISGRTSTQANIPLQVPPPPAPFVEANTANDPPAQITLLNGYTGSKGSRDSVDGVAFKAHLHGSTSATYDGYTAFNADVFAEGQTDLARPLGSPFQTTHSRFIGESTTFTSAHSPDRDTFFQMRETVGAQLNDYSFAPSAGGITWLTPLTGPVAHIAASAAAGKGGRFYSVDLFGFRLSNVYDDFASEESLQATIPLFDAPGWLISAGTQTQVASDRMAALEQGLLGNYASALPKVAPTPLPGGTILPSPRRVQRLANVSLQSPFSPIGRNVSVKFIAGYNTGLVTGCSIAATATPASPFYVCALEPTNHVVGGLFFQVNGGNYGNLQFGATDSPTLSNNVSPASANRSTSTTGGLPGAVTAYLKYNGKSSNCPAIYFAYANAAFPSNIPLPQQGTTLAGEVEHQARLGDMLLDLAVGYFNERPSESIAPASAGAFISVRLNASSRSAKPSC